MRERVYASMIHEKDCCVDCLNSLRKNSTFLGSYVIYTLNAVNRTIA